MDVTGNPWIVLAADVAGLVASGNGNSPGDVINISGTLYKIVWPNISFVLQVEFMQYIADADTCTIVRKNGKDLWDGNGASDLETVRSGVIGWIDGGIAIPNNGITNGIVKIYHR